MIFASLLFPKSCAAAISRIPLSFSFASRLTCSPRFRAMRSYLWIRMVSKKPFSQSRSIFWYCRRWAVLEPLPLTASSMYISAIVIPCRAAYSRQARTCASMLSSVCLSEEKRAYMTALGMAPPPYWSLNNIMVIYGWKDRLTPWAVCPSMKEGQYFFSPPREGVLPMYVTYSELFQFCTVIIGIVTLCVTIAINIKKK